MASQLALGMVGMGLFFALREVTIIAEAETVQPIALECSLDRGPWEPCQMVIMELGQTWLVVMGPVRILFRHDGKGTVAMKRRSIWRSVKPEWREDRTLCWGELCVRGDVPLD